MKPIVGLTPNFDAERGCFWMPPGYLEVVEACGAVAVVLAQTSDAQAVEQSIGLLDGLLLTGGVDIEPSAYGVQKLPCCGQTQPERDAFELMALRCARDCGIPILGICRGLQLINVAYGGTLFQDTVSERPGSLEHRMPEPYDVPFHSVEVFEGSPLATVVGPGTLPINSRHHQGVLKLGDGLSVMAAASDGVVEAVHDPNASFLWAVQWHPENMWTRDPLEKAIVQAFVDACARR